MTPRDLGLPANNPRIHEAVTLFDRNARFSAEHRDLGGKIIRLLQKRRHDNDDTLCVALLGRSHKSLDPIIREHLGAETGDLVAQARALHDSEYEGFAEAPEELKVYCLAHAAEALEGMADLRLPKIGHFRRLDEALEDAPTQDPGLEKIFTRRLDERRTGTLVTLGLKSWEHQNLPQDNVLVKDAFLTLEELAEDGRITPQNLQLALTTAKFINAMQKEGEDRTAVAVCLVDFGLMSNRMYADRRLIAEGVGEEMASLIDKHSPSRLWSEKNFAAAPEATRLAATGLFIMQSTILMKDIERMEKLGRTGTAHTQALKKLERVEERARKIILPHLDTLSNQDIADVFMLKMEMTAQFTFERAPPPPKPPLLLLPPAPPSGPKPPAA